MYIECIRWISIAASAVHEAFAWRLDRVHAQRAAVRAWLCMLQAHRKQSDLAVVHAKRVLLIQVTSPSSVMPPDEATAVEWRMTGAFDL